jgi:FG-GAP-like repeat
MKSDFNGDGKADVLWQNTSGSRALWLMNGSTFGNSIFLPSVATSWKIVGSGDFNGDGQMDILWQNSSGARAIWLMNGITHSSSVYFGTAATSWNIRNY